MLNITSDQFFQMIGAFSTASFLFVAFSDMLVHSLNIIVDKFLVPNPSIQAQRLVYIWGALKEIYEEFRKFMDKLSAYSRPRSPAKE